MKIKSIVKSFLGRQGYALKRARIDGLPFDFTEEESKLVASVQKFTMTDGERIIGLQRAVRYICDNEVPGDFVECGVWKGGSSMVAAIEFKKREDYRDLFLLDSYDMPIPAPLEIDKDVNGHNIFGGATETQPYWNAATVEEVRSNILSTGYPERNLKIVKGLVSKTIPSETPDSICILRLDTDTYESTKHEMEQLYPSLSSGGILIVDDYGTHSGARKAVEDYFSGAGSRPMITRLDNSGVIAVKI